MTEIETSRKWKNPFIVAQPPTAHWQTRRAALSSNNKAAGCSALSWDNFHNLVQLFRALSLFFLLLLSLTATIAARVARLRCALVYNALFTFIFRNCYNCSRYVNFNSFLVFLLLVLAVKQICPCHLASWMATATAVASVCWALTDELVNWRWPKRDTCNGGG